MPVVQVQEGRHLTADEWKNGRLVKPARLYFQGEDMVVSAAEATELVKDAKRFKDKGKA